MVLQKKKKKKKKKSLHDRVLSCVCVGGDCRCADDASQEAKREKEKARERQGLAPRYLQQYLLLPHILLHPQGLLQSPKDEKERVSCWGIKASALLNSSMAAMARLFLGRPVRWSSRHKYGEACGRGSIDSTPR